MSLSLGHLAVFHAVAEAGGVSRAAERLMVSQPAVSKQLKDLQRATKTRLIERDGRGIRLTQAGRVLAGYAQQMFALVSEAEVALSDLDALRRGTVAVGVTPTVGTYLLPDALVYFRRRFPGVDVRAETAEPSLLGPRVAEGFLDFAIGDETVVFPGMQRRRLTDLPFVAIAPAKHALVRRRRLTLTDLSGQALIVRESPGEPIVERYLAGAGVVPAATIGFASTEAVKRAVRAGLGVAVVPRIAVDERPAGLATLRIRDLTLTRTLYEVWDGRRPRSKAAHALHCVLEHASRGTLPRAAKIRRKRRRSQTHA